MHEMLRNSLTYRILSAAYGWFGMQWRSSSIIGRFLSPGKGEQISKSSIIARIWLLFHMGLCFVFEKLRLNRLLRSSVFTMPFIWSLAVIVLAPFLPTMHILAISIVCAVSLIAAFACDRERKLAYSPINKYTLLYAFVYIGATLTSVTVSGSLSSGALTTAFIIFAFIIQNSISSKRQLTIMIFAFVAAGTAVSTYGLYQYVFGAVGASAWLDAKMFAGIGVRVYSTLENPNVLAQYLLLTIPFAGACALNVKGFLKKLLLLGCLGVMLLCMMLTFARGGWLGLIIAAAVFLVMLNRRFILLIIAGLVILYFTLPDVILKRFLSIGNVGDSSTSYRVSIWLATIEMLRDYWFTGIGPGTAAFNRIYPIYSFNAAAAQHSHNLYLQIMCNAGVAGITVFLICQFAYFKRLCSAVSKEINKTNRVFQIAAISSILGFLAQGMTDYSFYNYRVTIAYWAVLGLGMATARSAFGEPLEGECLI